MQSSETKSKRSRKKVEESVQPAAQTQVTPAVEENTKSRRTSKKSTVESTAAAKQHRGAAKKATSAVSQPPVTARPVEISHNEIAQLAYSYWAERGYQGGSPDEDWFRAERYLTAR